MSRTYPAITDNQRTFIGQQKIFFVATAAQQGSVNISPKGMDSLRVLDENRVVWLNLTGSGNETSAHLQQVNRITIMFCSFSGKPMILRLYGKAKEITRDSPEWNNLHSLFSTLPGSRQIFDIEVEQVQTSCGTGVPLFDYIDDRDQLNSWAIKKGEQGIRKYWEDENQISLDGLPTNIMKKKR